MILLYLLSYFDMCVRLLFVFFCAGVCLPFFRTALRDRDAGIARNGPSSSPAVCALILPRLVLFVCRSSLFYYRVLVRAFRVRARGCVCVG